MHIGKLHSVLAAYTCNVALQARIGNYLEFCKRISNTPHGNQILSGQPCCLARIRLTKVALQIHSDGGNLKNKKGFIKMSIDLSKSYEYFQPEKYDEPIHIVGTGSVGLTVAELLVRSGLTNLVLWDFDKVEPHNLANQMFRQQDVGKLKVEAAKDILMEINPDVKDIKLRKNGWNGQNMSGFIFLAVDSIELRKKIVEQHFDSPYVKAVFDFRTGLEDAQSFAADWNNQKMKEALLATMQFTDEEANKQNPVSACNVSLAVAPTIRVICSLGVANFMNYWNDKELKKIIVCNPYIPAIEAY